MKDFLIPLAYHSCKSNALNLHRNALGKFLDSNAGSRWLVGEVLLIHAVHLGKVAHGSKEDGRLDTISPHIHIHTYIHPQHASG